MCKTTTAHGYTQNQCCGAGRVFFRLQLQYKKQLLTNFQPPHSKNSLIFKDLIFNLPFINVGTKEENSFQNVFFYLSWSRTYPQAPAKMSRLRNTAQKTLTVMYKKVRSLTVAVCNFELF